MPQNNHLIRGRDKLAQQPDFQLVGRDKELKQLAGVLMRKQANSVLLVGTGGVGCSALCLGLQASKNDSEASFDIINKRIYWLDTDGLFASGDPSAMNEHFQKLLRTLSRSKESILIIEDARDFIEAARNNGCTNFINALVREIRMNKFQVIFETRDDDLEVVLKCHSDMREYYTMLDIKEPAHESLTEIITVTSKRLEQHHKITISEGAIATAIDLTNKYRVREMSLSRAQPERSLNLLDRALTTYRQRAHAAPAELTQLNQQLSLIEAAIAGDESSEFLHVPTEQLLSKKSELLQLISQQQEQWQSIQQQLRKCYKNQRDGEEGLIELENALLKQQEVEQAQGDTKPEPETLDQFRSFSASLAAGFESEAISKIRAEIAQMEAYVKENKQAFEQLTRQVNANLCLDVDSVLAEFSAISGIATDKLNQDERSKLLKIHSVLNSRVYGQDHAVDQLADAVRVARVGLKDPEKPQASFMFLGPSGTGKTELAKALAAALFDDERALLRFDMSEYMEKHGVAKLIGAPPGYEGYEAGGILTNSMRSNPRVIVLFDEMEKAHPDVFNVLLQVLDDGRLTDNRGLTVSFGEAIILMTTNIGQPNFLDENLSFDEAVSETMKELDQVYRPEFLNRFNGRENIVCFNRLDLAVVEKIARREIDKLNRQIKASGKNININISDQTLADICQDIYVPAIGARGLPGYITTRIKPAVANTLLQTPDAEGEMLIKYDITTKQLNISAPTKQAVLNPA
ncbi:AAA family ATPase [Motilimonas sp. 1_MG-2023]|uniref:AAA family ATPase n=1 Tax=Motilimonas sp. 1_MG-2023 TaxID=3062672 RepID=UPI0026E3A602|nr:AAA family ATPase [Motilimonas sp. 1_MG-2023]MDO6525269.1 AAA family ATPase [Motilimonas sp. 1_MG-2023]